MAREPTPRLNVRVALWRQPRFRPENKETTGSLVGHSKQYSAHGSGTINDMAMLSPSASPAMSQVSTVFGIDSTLSLEDAKALQRRAIKRVKAATTAQDILLFLVAFRILNALSVKTFFQPDEYFQSLEPAWEIAFGANSGAWITWVNCANQSQDDINAEPCRNGDTSLGLRYILRCSLSSTGLLLL